MSRCPSTQRQHLQTGDWDSGFDYVRYCNLKMDPMIVVGNQLVAGRSQEVKSWYAIVSKGSNVFMHPKSFPASFCRVAAAFKKGTILTKPVIGHSAKAEFAGRHHLPCSHRQTPCHQGCRRQDPCNTLPNLIWSFAFVIMCYRFTSQHALLKSLSI